MAESPERGKKIAQGVSPGSNALTPWRAYVFGNATLVCRGVVSAAGLGFVLPVVDSKVNLAVGPVVLGIGGRIADQILGAQLVGDLVKGGGGVTRVVRPDYPASGFF